MARPKRICSVDGCGKPHAGFGYCMGHYRRFRKYGDPTAGKTPAGEPAAFMQMASRYQEDGCLFWPYARSVHGQAFLGGSNNFGSVVVARHVCAMAHGPAPSPSHHAAHSCGNSHLGCVNQKHLRWATASENEADKIAHGTRAIGDRHCGAKVTNDIVRHIRVSTELQRVLAARYGIAQQTVSRIKGGKSWAHVKL